MLLINLYVFQFSTQPNFILSEFLKLHYCFKKMINCFLPLIGRAYVLQVNLFQTYYLLNTLLLLYSLLTFFTASTTSDLLCNCTIGNCIKWNKFKKSFLYQWIHLTFRKILMSTGFIVEPGLAKYRKTHNQSIYYRKRRDFRWLTKH